MPASDRAHALFCADESWRWIPLQLKSSTFEQQALFERDSQSRFTFDVRGKQRIATPFILPRDFAWVPAGQKARDFLPAMRMTHLAPKAYMVIVKLS
jgi:hypothetical protein